MFLYSSNRGFEKSLLGKLTAHPHISLQARDAASPNQPDPILVILDFRLHYILCMFLSESPPASTHARGASDRLDATQSVNYRLAINKNISSCKHQDGGHNRFHCRCFFFVTRFKYAVLLCLIFACVVGGYVRSFVLRLWEERHPFDAHNEKWKSL